MPVMVPVASCPRSDCTVTDPPVGACPVVHGAGHAAPFAAPVNAVDARVVAAPPDDVGAPMRSTYFPVNATVASEVLSAFPDVSDAICVVCAPTVVDSPDTCDAEAAASDAACDAADCAVCAAADADAAEVAAVCAVDNAVDAVDAVDADEFCNAVIAVSA